MNLSFMFNMFNRFNTFNIKYIILFLKKILFSYGVVRSISDTHIQ